MRTSTSAKIEVLAAIASASTRMARAAEAGTAAQASNGETGVLGELVESARWRGASVLAGAGRLGHRDHSFRERLRGEGGGRFIGPTTSLRWFARARRGGPRRRHQSSRSTARRPRYRPPMPAHFRPALRTRRLAVVACVFLTAVARSQPPRPRLDPPEGGMAVVLLPRDRRRSTAGRGRASVKRHVAGVARQAPCGCRSRACAATPGTTSRHRRRPARAARRPRRAQ